MVRVGGQVNDVELVAGWVHEAGRGGTILLTGAGISTDSGIPDYRGPNGVWTRDPLAMRSKTFDVYLSDLQARVDDWQERMRNPMWEALPNAGHHAIADLVRAGWVKTVCTQNIDGLQQLADTPEAAVLELHGTARWVSCLRCGDRTPTPEVLARVRAGEPDPACPACGGVQKVAMIAFGQSLDPTVIRAASAAVRACALLIAAGTSLTVHPAAGLCDIAKESGARLIVCNVQPTPYDDLADSVIRHPVGEFLPALAAQVAAA